MLSQEHFIGYVTTTSNNTFTNNFGSDDHVKWQSRLLKLIGRIREKIQHPNDSPQKITSIVQPENLAAKMSKDSLFFLCLPIEKPSKRSGASLYGVEPTPSAILVHSCSALPIELITGQSRAGLANQQFKMTGMDHSTTHNFF